jgi:hypothetical protein
VVLLWASLFFQALAGSSNHFDEPEHADLYLDLWLQALAGNFCHLDSDIETAVQRALARFQALTGNSCHFDRECSSWY